MLGLRLAVVSSIVLVSPAFAVEDQELSPLFTCVAKPNADSQLRVEVFARTDGFGYSHKVIVSDPTFTSLWPASKQDAPSGPVFTSYLGRGDMMLETQVEMKKGAAKIVSATVEFRDFSVQRFGREAMDCGE